MTEAEWLTSQDVTDLLAFMKTKRRFTRRALTLLGAAGCRRLVGLFPAPVCLEAIEAAEAFADGTIDAAQLQAARDRLTPFRGGYTQTVRVLPAEATNAVHALTDPKEVKRVTGLSSDVLGLLALRAIGKLPETLPYEAIPDFWSEPEFKVARAAAGAVERGFLRDIFGNPFRRVKFDAQWRTDTAVSLARRMYESRDFSAMPVLADALQDAGCARADTLDHCRAPGPHVRGCWVVDGVLGEQ